jgi:pSer/pThr/pTyr-binding forkhead associated (FHA) protein
MTGKLVSNGEKWSFSIPEVVLGRSSSATIPVQDPTASRFHALIRLNHDNTYEVVDWGSRNGTFLNDAPLIQPAPLNPGDKIRIGEQVFTFTIPEKEHASSIRKGFTKPTEKAPPSTNMLVFGCVCHFAPNWDSLPFPLSSWMSGQFLSRSSAEITDLGGVIDRIGPGSFLAYWVLHPKELHQSVKAVLGAVRAVRKIAFMLEDEVGTVFPEAGQIQMKPLIALDQAFHPTRELGDAHVQRHALTGPEAGDGLELAARAGQAASGVVVTESFQNLMGTQAIAHPYCIANVGERQKSTVLYQLSG